jgi:hypothetical protein
MCEIRHFIQNPQLTSLSDDPVVPVLEVSPSLSDTATLLAELSKGRKWLPASLSCLKLTGRADDPDTSVPDWRLAETSSLPLWERHRTGPGSLELWDLGETLSSLHSSFPLWDRAKHNFAEFGESLDLRDDSDNSLRRSLANWDDATEKLLSFLGEGPEESLIKSFGLGEFIRGCRTDSLATAPRDEDPVFLQFRDRIMDVSLPVWALLSAKQKKQR